MKAIFLRQPVLYKAGFHNKIIQTGNDYLLINHDQQHAYRVMVRYTMSSPGGIRFFRWIYYIAAGGKYRIACPAGGDRMKEVRREVMWEVFI